MRTQQVEISGKTITIKELRLGELKKLFDDLMNGTMSEADKLFKADLPSDASQAINGMVAGFLGEKLGLIIPGLTQEDFENAYSSEIEEAIKAFVEVNFMGVKRIGVPLLKLLFSAPNLKQQQPSCSADMMQQ